MNDTIKEHPLALIGVLAAVCVIAGLALGFVSMATSERIDAEKRKAEREALLVVHPDAKGFEEVKTEHKGDGKEFTYYRVYDKPLDDEDKTLVGYACEGRAQGYSSTIVVTIGLDADAATITGIKITAQQETPGLGANCEQIASNKYLWAMFSKRDGAAAREPRFQAQFRERNVDSLVREGKSFRDVRVLSGATITTNAVVRATLNAIERLREGSGWTPDAVGGGTKKGGRSRAGSDATRREGDEGPGEETE